MARPNYWHMIKLVVLWTNKDRVMSDDMKPEIWDSQNKGMDIVALKWIENLSSSQNFITWICTKIIIQRIKIMCYEGICLKCSYFISRKMSSKVQSRRNVVEMWRSFKIKVPIQNNLHNLNLLTTNFLTNHSIFRYIIKHKITFFFLYFKIFY